MVNERAGPSRRRRVCRLASLPGLVTVCVAALTSAAALGDRASDRPASRALADPAIQADAGRSARRWEARERRVLSPAGRVKRARSRTRHRDLSASSVLRVTREQFPAFSSQPAFKGYRPAPGESIERYLRAGTARVLDRAGHRSIVESTYPLTGRTASGRAAPIDLTLEPHGSGFAPASAAVESRFPRRIADGIEVEIGDDSRLALRPANARDAKAARLSSGKVIYANTDVDTDTLAAAMPFGVELFTQIRSAASPELHAFQVDLPPGAALRKRGRGAEVVRGRDRLGVVNPPLAWDAEDRPVPVRLSITRDRLRLVVPHRNADVAYPVMVDPLIENFQHWRSDPNVDWLYWWFDAPSGFNWDREGAWGRGAYLVTNGMDGADYPHTWSSYARFAAPGDAYVYAAEFNLLRHEPPSGGPMCVSAGIHSGATNDWESPVWTQCGYFWDQGYGTCVNGGGSYPDCNEGSGSPPNEMRLQYWAFYPGPRGAYGVANMGGALVKISDRNAPSVQHDSTPSGWASSHNLSVSARDTGLGLRRIAVTSPTDPTWSGAERTWNCDGSRLARYENRCSSNWETLGYSSSGLSDGIQTVRATAEDGLPRTSPATDAFIKIDSGEPEVHITGGLWELKDQVASETDLLDIHVEAQDGVPNGPNSERRSGVASIEVKVGDERIGFASQTCEDSCPLSLDADLDTDAVDEGPQTISVEVYDQAGHRFFDSWTIDVPGPTLYGAQLASWQASVESEVDEALPAPLTGPMPSPPAAWRTPSNCRPEDGEVRVCFDFAKQWQRALQEWLTSNGAAGVIASGLPDMPRYDYGRDRVARWLARASVFTFERARENAADPVTRRTALISFHHPVSLDYIQSLVASMGLTHAKSIRGTFEEIGKPITAGFYEKPDSPAEPIVLQLDAFYAEQIAGVDDIVAGLGEELVDETAEEQAETNVTIAEVEEYRTALLGRAPFVAAVVADVDVAGLVSEAADPASPIKTADLLAPDEPLEADDGAGTDRSMTADADVGDPGPPAEGGEVSAAGNSVASEFQASNWNGRTKVYGGGKKNNYIGLAWTQPGTLKWYQGDDPHDRGFEAQARPKSGGNTWSDGWVDGWASNLPDPYRDDLTSDDEYKQFAIGSANGIALKFRKKYFGWYNTDDGGPDNGVVTEEGERTVRARNIGERGYCSARAGRDKYCFFRDFTNTIQEYIIENRYSRVRRTWP